VTETTPFKIIHEVLFQLSNKYACCCAHTSDMPRQQGLPHSLRSAGPSCTDKRTPGNCSLGSHLKCPRILLSSNGTVVKQHANYFSQIKDLSCSQARKIKGNSNTENNIQIVSPKIQIYLKIL
jgi:hypothetical protein